MQQVLNQKNWDVTVDLPRLKGIVAKPMGPRHCPVNHGEMLEMFQSRLTDNKFKLGNEKGLLSPDLKKYVYVAEIADNIQDFNFTVGFVNYNNRERALTGIAGETVMVCSNQVYTGVIPGSKRHTTNIGDRLYDKIDDIIEQFKVFRDKRTVEIDNLKGTKFNDNDVSNVLLHAIRYTNIAASDLGRIVQEWDHPRHVDFTPRTAWSFLNSITEVSKRTKNPIARMDLTSNLSNYITENFIN